MSVSETINICGGDPNCFEIQSCKKLVNRSFDVSVPVTITPFAIPEKPEVRCAGEIEVTPGHKCCENPDNSFEFTITQKVSIDIPIKFGAETCFGKTCAVGECKCDHHTFE
jgi:hypothetical protein